MKKIIFVLAIAFLCSCEKQYIDPDQKPRTNPTGSTFHPQDTTNTSHR